MTNYKSNSSKSQAPKSEIAQITAKRHKIPYISDLMSELGEKGRAHRMSECATTLTTTICPNGHRHIIRAQLCRDRLCPVCAWRRSRMLYGQIFKCIHKAVEKHGKLKYLFLTLTIKNVPAEGLSEAIDQLYGGWKRLCNQGRSKMFRDVAGWIRNLEITYNSEADTYHPHLHVLLSVWPSYFNNRYIQQDKWREAWKQSCNLSYNPQIKIQGVRQKSKRQPLESAAAETAKYSVKDADYTTGFKGLDKLVLNTYMGVLRHRRLIEWGGIYKEIHRELDLIDTETGNIDIEEAEHNENCGICGEWLATEVMKWDLSLSTYIAMANM